ncbi:MAG: hypothetical protein DDT26_00761 [Dehalococcoidia bacterium]|nr:hypothetical protein [Chloroflexota bacterium]
MSTRNGLIAVAGILTAIAIVGATQKPPFRAAVERCQIANARGVVLGGGGRFLHMRAGVSQELSLRKVGCVLSWLNAPQTVNAQIESTNAIMGTQTAHWDNIEARWTYNGFTGLSINFEIR